MESILEKYKNELCNGPPKVKDLILRNFEKKLPLDDFLKLRRIAYPED